MADRTTLDTLRAVVASEAARLEKRAAAGGLDKDDLKNLQILARVAKMTAVKDGAKPADGPLTDDEVNRLVEAAKNATPSG